MSNLSKFCTCNNLECPLHPSNHDKGCAPCISKNLKLKEIPSCFFNLVEDSASREEDSFEEFANLIVKNR